MTNVFWAVQMFVQQCRNDVNAAEIKLKINKKLKNMVDEPECLENRLFSLGSNKKNG